MSLIATLMQELRSQYTPQYDQNELRESRYGALRAFQEDASQRPIFDPETIANIMRSYGNTVQVPVLDAQAVTVTSPYTRTCVVADSENDSALVALTFASFGWRFSMTPATHYNNDINYMRDFERKIRKYAIQFASDLDDLCIAQLDTDKNAVWTGLVDFYAVVADALQVPQAGKNDFYNNLESIMAVADFYDMITVISSTKHMPLVRRLDNQGSSNATNEGFQMALRSYDWKPTNRIANGAGVESAGYAVQNGSTFIWNRNDADTVIGGNIGGDVKIWSQEQMPIANMLMGAYYQQDCGDRSAINSTASAGNTRSRYEGFEFSTDVVVATAYNSDPATRYNPIVKFEVLNA